MKNRRKKGRKPQKIIRKDNRNMWSIANRWQLLLLLVVVVVVAVVVLLLVVLLLVLIFNFWFLAVKNCAFCNLKSTSKGWTNRPTDGWTITGQNVHGLVNRCKVVCETSLKRVKIWRVASNRDFFNSCHLLIFLEIQENLLIDVISKLLELQIWD